MMPDDYYAQRTAAPGSNLHYSLMFLPPEKRRAANVVYALGHALQEIVDAVNDPNVARTKLEWWHQEIQRLLQGTPRHPVTQSLMPLMETYELPREQLVELLSNVTETTLDNPRFEAFDALYRHCIAVGAIPQRLTAKIYGVTDDATYRYAEKLGAALRLTEILARVGEDARRQRLYLAREELRQYGVSEQDVFNYRHTTEFAALMVHTTQRVLHCYNDALMHLPAADRTRQLPGLISVNIARALLDEIRRDGFRVLEHRVALTPLRKLWIAWRTRLLINIRPRATA